jgi:hypothetical protein
MTKVDFFDKYLDFCQKWRKLGRKFVTSEYFRPYWVAMEYFKRKVGIINSKHTKFKAFDLWPIDEKDEPVTNIISNSQYDEMLREMAKDWELNFNGTAGYFWKKVDKFHFEEK